MKSSNKYNDDENERRKRRNFICFCLIIGIKGVEIGVVKPTLYSYLKNEIKPKHLSEWYGLISCSYYVASIIGSLTFTKYADKTRNIRPILNFTCLSISFGNIIYSLPFSPYPVLIGRFIQGFGDGVTPVIMGEITRNFTPRQTYDRISKLVCIFYLSLVTSPIITKIFDRVNLKIGYMHFTVNNLPFILISFIWLILAFVCHMIIKNIISIEETSTKTSKQIIYPLSLRELLSSVKFRIVMIMTSFSAYFSASFASITMPMISYEKYHLPTWWVSGLFAISALTLLVFLCVSSRMNISGGKEIYFSISGFCGSMIAVQFLIGAVIASSSSSYKMLGESLLVFAAISTGYHFATEEALLSAILGRFVPRSTQTYALGIRRSTQSCGLVFASFFSPMIAKHHVVEHGIVFSCLVFVMIVYALYKSSLFVDMKVIRRKKKKKKKIK